MDGKINTEDIIRNIEKKVEIICSDEGEVYVKLNSSIVELEGPDFESWLRQYCYTRMDKFIPPASAPGQVQAHLKMLALNSNHHTLYRRVCIRKGNVYYDLGLPDNQYLKISKEQIGVVETTRLLFLRNSVFLPQVEPDLTGQPEGILSLIDKHFHIKKESDKIILATFLIGCFFTSKVPTPVLQVYGEKGSGKTIFAEHLLSLLNPTSAGGYSLPRKADDVAIVLSSDYMVIFDNVSWISNEISDLFCRNCTGGTHVKRRFFTDNSQRRLKLGAVVVFNSTHQSVMRSDLADRTLYFQLERFRQEERQGDYALNQSWKKDLPAFFGDLCLAVQGVLNDSQEAEYQSPIRLTDWYELCVKAGRQLGYSEEDVYFAFEENRKCATESIVGGDVLLYSIEQFILQKEYKKYNSYETALTLSCSEWFQKLKFFALDNCGVRKGFPGAPEVLTRRMGENKSNLEEIGIYFEIKKKHDKNYISIWKE